MVISEDSLYLGLTKSEAEIISQRIGHVFPCADGALVEVIRRNGRSTQGEALAERRGEIERITAEEGRVIPCRAMAAKLKGRGFNVGTYVSVSTDYKAMGLTTERAAKLRALAVSRATQGALILESAETGCTMSTPRTTVVGGE